MFQHWLTTFTFSRRHNAASSGGNGGAASPSVTDYASMLHGWINLSVKLILPASICDQVQLGRNIAVASSCGGDGQPAFAGVKFRQFFALPMATALPHSAPEWTTLSKRNRSRSSGNTSTWNSARMIEA